MKDDFNYISLGPASGGAARQVVFLLHGVGMHAGVMEKMAQDAAAILPDALIVMPQGPEAYAPPQPREDDLLKAPEIPENSTARQWFDIGGDIPAVREKLIGVAQKFNAFVDKKRDEHGLSDKNVAVMGFSQGGGVALYAAFLRAAEIGCVVGHSTIFFNEPSFVSKPPTLFIYGTADNEFSMPAYTKSTQKLLSYAPLAQIVEVPGLQHRTSSDSRRIAAGFLGKHLGL